MQQRKDFKMLDILKFFFAICVVLRHTDLIEDYPINEWVAPLIFRISVPFFFVTSGFLLGLKVYNDDSEISKLYKKGGYLGRLASKLFIFEPISIFLEIVLLILIGDSIKHIILYCGRSIVFYPFGALWYIQALLVAVLILVPFIKHKKEHVIILISLLLYVIGCLGNNYFFLIQDTPLEKVMRLYLQIARSQLEMVFL